MATRKRKSKHGYRVTVREHGGQCWSYAAFARSSGQAVERILHGMGWIEYIRETKPLIVTVEQKDTFILG